MRGQGIKSIPNSANIWWCYGAALAVIVLMALLTSSSYGKALKAIREDQIAAESMGVSLFFHMYALFPRLKERSWQLAGTLSGGEQQMLAVARALMSRPKLLMMDEPSLGLAPLVVQNIFSIIRTIRDSGVTVLLIEQNANAALKVADRGYVLETGRITLEGAGDALRRNPEVRAAYLGKS